MNSLRVMAHVLDFLTNVANNEPARNSSPHPETPAEINEDEELLDAYSRAVTGVVERVGPAVVSITISGQRQSSRRPEQAEGSGSGVLFTPDGYILTNAHVVRGSRSVKVELMNGNTYQA